MGLSVTDCPSLLGRGQFCRYIDNHRQSDGVHTRMAVTSATNARAPAGSTPPERPPGAPVGRGGEVGRRGGGHGQEVRVPLGAVGAKRRRRAGSPCADAERLTRRLPRRRTARRCRQHAPGRGPGSTDSYSRLYAARSAVSQPFGSSTAGKESAAGRRRWWPRWPWGRPSGPTSGTRAFPSGCTPASTLCWSGWG